MESRDVDIKCTFPEFLPAISADSQQLKQAFYNIIKNAVQAMPGGGELEIKCIMMKISSVWNLLIPEPESAVIIFTGCLIRSRRHGRPGRSGIDDCRKNYPGTWSRAYIGQ